jgi:predicted unusual protein kinase regulating ubiquinone biosynthesis (AarF/ABC1/UbiB family)
MGISLKSQHLKRYKDIVMLLMRHGRKDLVSRVGLEEVAVDDEPVDEGRQQQAADLAADLERLGPTFVKLGQMLSTRADLLPPEYLEALARLQDEVEPFPFGEVEEIVATELGVRISKAFSEFESEPIAAASLGQVHRGVLRDGRAVAVKIQRPGVREVITDDLDALEAVAEWLDAHTEAGRVYEFTTILDTLRRSLLQELDYQREADNLEQVGKSLVGYDRIVVPQPIRSYTTKRVLTMDYVSGRKVTSISPLARIDLDGPGLADHLFDAYLHQILVDGVFHADPHPGNVLITPSGRIGLIDLGMVANIPSAMQEDLLHLLLAIADGRGDEAADLAVKIGDRRSDFDERGFRDRIVEFVAKNRNATVEQMDVGRMVLEVTTMAGTCGVRLPREFTMIGKTLLNIDQVVMTLDPNFKPNATIRRKAPELMRQRVARSTTTTGVFTSLLEAKDFAERLPSRVNRLLDMAASNQLMVTVDAIDEHLLMEGLQKIANRITLGLVLAALIVGAALLMRVETSFTIFGYPGLAILLFLAASGMGFMLVVNIFLTDDKAKR